MTDTIITENHLGQDAQPEATLQVDTTTNGSTAIQETVKPTETVRPNATAELVTDSGIVFQLKYYLQTYASTTGAISYGVVVHKVDLAGKLKESSESYAITTSKEKAQIIISFLANGTVPPCTLVDMVEEWFVNDMQALNSKHLFTPEEIACLSEEE